MRETPKISAKIVVGISFDHGMERVVKTVGDLFHQTDPEVTLLHVVTPAMEPILESSLDGLYEGICKSIQDHTDKIALDRLERLAATLMRKIEVRVAVVRGFHVADALVGYAVENDADMLVLSSAKTKSLMTACETIGKHALPVMIVHEDTHLIDFSSRHRVFVSDDLRSGGESSVKTAFMLMNLIGDAEILHTHVMTPLDCVKFAESQRSTLHSKYTGDDLTRHLRLMKDQLRQRMAAISGLPVSSGAIGDDWEFYSCEVPIGTVVDELQRSAVSFRADIAVFSEHKIFHKNLQHAGSVPLHAMLAHDRIVVISMNSIE